MINLDSNREGQIKVCRYLIFKLFSQATYCILLMNLKLFQEPFTKIFSFLTTKGKSEKLISYIAQCGKTQDTVKKIELTKDL